MNYFWIDLDGCISFADTADEAKANAGEQIAIARSECDHEGWPEEVTEVCWGVVMECATEIPCGAACVDYVLRGTGEAKP
jgi:hypothetical protein